MEKENKAKANVFSVGQGMDIFWKFTLFFQPSFKYALSHYLIIANFQKNNILLKRLITVKVINIKGSPIHCSL